MNTMQKAKGESFLRTAINAAILAGIIILALGAYYLVIKAGIPYQDPPPELQMQYAVNYGIGTELTKDGFWISVCAGSARLIFARAVKKHSERK